MQFLEKTVLSLLKNHQDLSVVDVVLPGKRPIVFIKKILSEQEYSGFLPNFITIEDLINEIADQQVVQGIPLSLFAYEVYKEKNGDEDFAQFLKWFPTILKDWDDILKFSENDTKVLEHLFADERIKNWAENLGEEEDVPRRRFLNFWKKMNLFLPELKKKLQEKGWATSGMVHEIAKNKTEEFAQKSTQKFAFCGFNAFTPVEEKLVRSLLQWDQCECYFQADEYYINDQRQEAGKFLREHLKWKEFHENRPFTWLTNSFSKPKEISVYEVSGNISQTKVLPDILAQIPANEISDTAIVLLDENLLPACLDVLSATNQLNITMGFPLKNLSFSNAIKKLFYIQKQIEKKDSSYYYNDVLSVLEEMPPTENDQQIISDFKAKIEERNMVYISKKQMLELLHGLSYLELFLKPENINSYLEQLINYCFQLKFSVLDDVQYENINSFEKSFKIIQAQILPYSFSIKMETLEVLISHLVNTESIDFRGEPLQGLQVMGLLETRLLNFKNIVLLSVNEGKLPLGNSQNTYLPFDVRKQFNLHTFLENDSIYAYHFYRLLQDAENIHLLYNALSSGVNTGEKSRFITQLEIEDQHHQIRNIIIENASNPIDTEQITIEKTPIVLEKLEEWKRKVSASNLTTYLYNPIDFYMSKILKTRESLEIEEELSQRSYGNLVHFALQSIYEKFEGKLLIEQDLELSTEAIAEAINTAVEKLKHQLEFYDRGMNYIHKTIAQRVVRSILEFDKNLIRQGNTLEIVKVEGNFENIDFYLDDEHQDKVAFYGYIDRIDRLNGQLRIIDYKTAKSKKLNIKTNADPEKLDLLFFNDDYKQAMQLSLYAYSVLNDTETKEKFLQCGIWSFAEVNQGVQTLNIDGENELSMNNLEIPINALRVLIAEILNPEIALIETIPVNFDQFG